MEKRYLQQRAQARMRDIEFTITLEEWCNLWITSGKWEQRGRRKDQYCMSRIGDDGAYELGNVFIQLHGDNVRDAQLGKMNLLKGRTGSRPPHSEECKYNISMGRKAFYAKQNNIKSTNKENVL